MAPINIGDFNTTIDKEGNFLLPISSSSDATKIIAKLTKEEKKLLKKVLGSGKNIDNDQSNKDANEKNISIVEQIQTEIKNICTQTGLIQFREIASFLQAIINETHELFEKRYTSAIESRNQSKGLAGIESIYLENGPKNLLETKIHRLQLLLTLGTIVRSHDYVSSNGIERGSGSFFSYADSDLTDEEVPYCKKTVAIFFEKTCKIMGVKEGLQYQLFIKKMERGDYDIVFDYDLKNLFPDNELLSDPYDLMRWQIFQDPRKLYIKSFFTENKKKKRNLHS